MFFIDNHSWTDTQYFKASFNKEIISASSLFARFSRMELAVQEISARREEFSDSLHSGADKTENRTFVFYFTAAGMV